MTVVGGGFNWSIDLAWINCMSVSYWPEAVTHEYGFLIDL